MIGQKLLIRVVGTLTCVAACAAGWDAEAARWHHRRACCSYETACCDPCCTRTCSYRVVESCPVVLAPTCCDGVSIAAAERPATATVVAAPTRPATATVAGKR